MCLHDLLEENLYTPFKFSRIHGHLSHAFCSIKLNEMLTVLKSYTYFFKLKQLAKIKIMKMVLFNLQHGELNLF